MTNQEIYILKYISNIGNIDVERIACELKQNNEKVVGLIHKMEHDGILIDNGYGINPSMFKMDEKYHFSIKVSKNALYVAEKLYLIGNITELDVMMGDIINGVMVVRHIEEMKLIKKEMEDIDGVDVVSVDYISKSMRRGVHTNALIYENRPIEIEDKRNSYLYKKYSS